MLMLELLLRYENCYNERRNVENINVHSNEIKWIYSSAKGRAVFRKFRNVVERLF